MECQAPPFSSFSSFKCVALPPSSSSSSSFNYPFLPRKPSNAAIAATFFSLKPNTKLQRVRKPRATIDEKDQTPPTPAFVQDEELQNQANPEVEKSVKVLKNAAKTRKVAKEEILSALSVIEKAKIDPSGFLETLGGSESPGRTWMLIFTAEKRLKSGRYFPLTAVQRFDAAGKRIENGVYLGPIGSLTFEGRFTWKTRILAFIFECIRVKIGPLDPFEFSLGDKKDREPSTKDPFFIWFYIDEEIAVARGRSGGTAFWCRCQRGKRIENGVYLGPIGSLTFEGRFTWKTRILAFIFDRIIVKIGPSEPFEFSFGDKKDREPSTKDPFFIWFYIDEEIAVARGRSGGTAFWCRCQRVTT